MPAPPRTPPPNPSLSSPPRPPPPASMKNENIVVAVRVRPYTRQELERHENVSAFEINTHSATITQRLTHAKPRKSLLPSQLPPYATQAGANTASSLSATAAVPLTSPLTFQCDRLYPSTASTAALYDGCVRDIVDSAMAGMNGTVFCYGQTASGKTHTMKGDGGQPGLLSLSMQHVFAAIEQRMGDKWLLRVSYIEIYNERIRDLLQPSNDNLAIHVTKDKGAHVAPREEVVRSVEECIALLEEGEKHRHYGCTQMNDFSSRSHTIFRLTIENKPQPPPNAAQPPAPLPPPSPPSSATSYQPPAPRRKDRVRVSMLNFVDLAGSERQAQTGAEGSRLKEGTFINKSLLNLGIVIARLSEQQKPSGAAGGSDGLVPFRDSKLTHILSGSLGGNSRVCVVCCVSAAVVNCEHSVSTLRFGARCARVRQTVKVNEVSGDAAEINRYEGKIKQLQSRLSVLPTQAAHTAAASVASAADAAKARREAEREDREEKEAMWEQRRLLAEDRMKVEEERVRLEEQISSFKQLMLTATSQQLTGTAAKQAALNKRRATFGNGRRSAEWKEATSPAPQQQPHDPQADDAALTAEQHDYYRAQQSAQRMAGLDSRVQSLETLLKELNSENSGLMKDYEETAADSEAMAARLEEMAAEVKQREVELADERRVRLQWQQGEGVDGLTDEELDGMRRGVEEVRRVVERQAMWREFCRARDGGGGAEEASSMERERKLKGELQRLKQDREREQQRHAATHTALTSEHDSLQHQHAGMTAQVSELQQQLDAVQTRVSEVEAENVDWKRQYELLASEERKLREENTQYSKRLLDVVRPVGTPMLPVAPARMAPSSREVSAMDVQLPPSTVTYSAAASAPPSPIPAAATPHFGAAHSYSALSSSFYSTASSTASFQPANLSSALAAAAFSPSPPGLMSAHMPHTAATATLPPPLSLDALMSSTAPPPLPQHPPTTLATAQHSPPFTDLTYFALNAASPGRPPTAVLSRAADSAQKGLVKGVPLSAGKRGVGAVSSVRRK